MRAVLQRVTGATVHVNGKLISRIGPGIVALIGIGTGELILHPSSSTGYLFLTARANALCILS